MSAAIVVTTLVVLAWLVGIPLYALRCRRYGHVNNSKLEEKGGTWLLNRWLMEYGYWVFSVLARLLIRWRVRPNQITASTLVVAALAAAAVYVGWFTLGGWLLIFSAILDVLDGVVARERQLSSQAGAFFDTIADRYCELLLFVAAMGYYFPLRPAAGLLVGLAMIASIMITFTRTKGEALGVLGLPSGLMRRHERLLIIGLGTAISPVLAAWLEPGSARPLFHLALGAYALVGVLGMYTALDLGYRMFQRLAAGEQPVPVQPTVVAQAEQRKPQANARGRTPTDGGAQELEQRWLGTH